MITLNTDYPIERLRQRQTEVRGVTEYCPACDAGLTDTDLSARECTACGASLVGDESADEDLVDDGYGDY